MHRVTNCLPSRVPCNGVGACGGVLTGAPNEIDGLIAGFLSGRITSGGTERAFR